MDKRVKAGFKALYLSLNRCRVAYLVSWSLSKFLFMSLVFPVIFFRTQVWGLGCKKRGSQSLERVQKIFLQEELDVRTQISYVIILVETSC